MSKQCVLITGASSGIGLACAKQLAERFRVYGTSRNPSSSEGEIFQMYRMDVRDDASVAETVQAIAAEAGRIDVLVNNAGFGIAGSLEENSVEDLIDQFQTNVFGAHRVTRAVLPIMKRQGQGLIINISSLAGRVALPFQGAYCSSKFALEGLSESYASELLPFGIRVVLVEPGNIATNFPARRTLASATNPEGFHFRRQIIEKDELAGIPANRVARTVEKIIDSPSPRMRYEVACLKERVLTYLGRIAPRFFQRMALLYYGGTGEKKSLQE